MVLSIRNFKKLNHLISNAHTIHCNFYDINLVRGINSLINIVYT